MSSSLQPTSERNPFVFFNTPSDYVVGADAPDGPGDIDFNLPPLMPFVWIPARIRRTDPAYLATILDRAVPVFETIRRSYALIPHSRAQKVILAGLLKLVFRGFPDHTRARPERLDCFSSRGRARDFSNLGHQFGFSRERRSFRWTSLSATPCPSRTILRFCGLPDPTCEFWCILWPEIVFARVTGRRWLFLCLNDALAPEYPIFANRVLAPSLVIPRLPHEDLSSEPYPVMDMSDYDPMWYWWRRIQDKRPQRLLYLGCACGVHFPALAANDSPRAIAFVHAQVAFDTTWPFRDARSPSPLPEMEVDPQEISPEDARAIAADMAAKKPTPVLRPCPARSTMRGGKTTRGRAPPAQISSVPDINPKGRPMIRVRSSRKSSTPPAEEAYNEEGEEEKDDNEEEEEEEESPRSAKRQRTGPATSKGKASGKGKGKGKARATTPAPVDTSTRCPIPVRKTCGKSKKGELPAYVPPQPVPPMDTISLAAETLASQRREPLVFDAGCSNCILRDRKCDHGAPRSLCEHCDKGCLSHCSHTFAVADHARAANHLEPYTRLSNERGNELITDLSAARADYELAREQLFLASARIAVASNRVSAWIRSVVTNLGPYGLPQITEIPEDLRPLWGQLLLEAEAELSVDYRAAIMRYPFISDPRRNNLPTDEDLPTLIEFLTRRAARGSPTNSSPARRVRTGRRRMERDHQGRSNVLGTVIYCN
ncbi:hypothetical protein B0H14DRAFT_2657165 [Mycena olivaceomarginata]|nr:hypothetical protein B0H14DRAFT_2657165 [Mycena olivaceomarginata]